MKNMSSIIYIQPIFAPNKTLLDKNLRSLESMKSVMDEEGYLPCVFGGWVMDDEYWNILSQYISSNFPNSIVKRFDNNYGKAKVVNELYNIAQQNISGFEYILTADSDIIFKNKSNYFNRLLEYASISHQHTNKPFGMVSLNQEEQNCHLIKYLNKQINYKSKFGNDESLCYPNGKGGIAGGCIFTSKICWEKNKGYRVLGVYSSDDAYYLVDTFNNGMSIQMFTSLPVIHPFEHDKGYSEWKCKASRDGYVTEDTIISKVEESILFWNSKNRENNV